MTPAANVTLAAPTGTRAIASRVSVGANAASPLKTPNAVAATTSSRGETLPRAPATSAPATEPTAIAVTSIEYDPGPPSKLNFASNGSSTWKLNASVPITAIIASGSASDGVAAT